MKKLILILLCIQVQISFSQWEAKYLTFPGLNIRAIVANDDKVIAGTSSGGIFISTDNGDNWSHQNTGIDGVSAFISRDDYIFAGTPAGTIYLSTDFGKTWEQKSNGLPGRCINSLAVSGGNIFAATDSTGVYLSTDSGESWTARNNGLPNGYVNRLAVSENKVFAAIYGNGVFVSTDSGESWTARNKGLDCLKIESISAAKGIIFAGTDSSLVFFSTDNGDNWIRRNLYPSAQSVYSIGAADNNIFASIPHLGIFLSTDYSDSWTEDSEGLADNSIVLSFGSNSGYVFAGTMTNVIYRKKLDSSLSSDDYGLNNSVKPGLDVYPNPSAGQFIMTYSGRETCGKRITITNSLGTIVKQYEENELSAGNSVTFSTGSLPPGVYYCTLISGTVRTIKEVVLVK